MNQTNPAYHGYRFPSEVISHAVWLYHRFCLSFRDVEDLLAGRFFKKLMKGQGRSARLIVTDKLPSYGAARKVIMPTSMHCHERYANNRAEVSHEHTQAQERQMRRFKSPGQS